MSAPYASRVGAAPSVSELSGSGVDGAARSDAKETTNVGTPKKTKKTITPSEAYSRGFHNGVERMVALMEVGGVAREADQLKATDLEKQIGEVRDSLLALGCETSHTKFRRVIAAAHKELKSIGLALDGRASDAQRAAN